jgi:sulfur carrier protein ThiS
MNPGMHIEEQLEIETQVQATRTEKDLLAQCGFSAEEIVFLLWLQHWYQTGGSDRVQIVRHLEFLRLLVLNGKMEL